MPATQRGQYYKLARVAAGACATTTRTARASACRRSRRSPRRSTYFRDVIEPELRGDAVPLPELTLAEFVADLLGAPRAPASRPRTISTLRDGSRYAMRGAFGDVPLRDLERMSGELAGWQATLPAALPLRDHTGASADAEAAVRWGHMSRNPAKLAGRNPQPSPRPVRAYTAAELDAIAAELSTRLPAAAGVRRRHRAAAGGVAGARAARRRPQRAGSLTVRRTVSSGEVVELGKTDAAAARCRSRAARWRPRRAPASARHAAAVPGAGGRAAQPRQLPPPRVGTGDRGRPASQSPRGSTTCARRSPATRSRLACPCSSSPG